MRNKSILHIAPQNFAGMPMDFVLMHRKHGYKSNLITLYKESSDFESDIKINLKLPTGKIANFYRSKKFIKKSSSLNNSIDISFKYYKQNLFEKIFFTYRDWKNKKIIEEFITKYKLEDFDIYHFDGGMDLFRDFRFAKNIKSKGKKIVSCYFGSDLRIRGIFKEMEELSDLNLTVEFDHTKIHPNINYIFFPFNCDNVQPKEKLNLNLKIIHSPTNRLFKGTEKILKVIDKLKKNFKFEFILIENTPRNKLLEIKRECDLAIDQIGGLFGGSGYGKNSIENFSMGLPTITEFTEDYLDFLPENPFITANENTLYDVIANIINNPEILIEYSKKSVNWLKKYHSYESVNQQLISLYKKYNIL
ncbi:MAG: hypothetical protein N2490_01275 [Ignavibacteria bacterium]|nr:hypothetical protein [Ignavibacteria bacterium]